jgi:hypothetical protein
MELTNRVLERDLRGLDANLLSNGLAVRVGVAVCRLSVAQLRIYSELSLVDNS